MARDALRMLALGVATGLLVAFPALGPREAVLFRTQLFDAGLIAAIVCGLMVVGLAAATLPAWRAARIGPVIALRE